MCKKILVFLMAFVLVSGMVPLVQAGAEEPTTIRVVWWGGQSRHDVTVQAINRFMEEHPDIKVEYEFSDFSSYYSKLATQVAGGLAPDVITIGYTMIVQYATNGILENLKPYVESGALDTTNISEATLAGGNVNGTLYAVPCGTNVPVLMYRNDILEQAGLTMPIAPTESEYAELQRKVLAATGRTNGSSTDWENGMRTIVRSYGLNLYNDDGTGLGFDDPSYIVYMWERYLREIEEGVKLGVGEGTATSAFDSYVNDVWAGSHFSNEISGYQSGSNCELSLSVLPAMDDGTVPSSYTKPTMYWAISSDSKKKEAALTFINWVTHDTDCYDIVGLDRGVPIASDVRDYLLPDLSDTDKKVFAIMNYVAEEGHSTPIMKPDVAAHGEINTLFGSYFEEVQYGLVTDLTAHAQAFMDEANALIQKSITAE